MAYAQNRTTNLSSAIPIRAMSRMKIRAMRAYRDLRRFSPTCWYEATASLAENAQPWIFIEGAGDDRGVVISVRVPDDANVPSCPEVDLHVPRGAKRGYDAGAMVRALRDIPGWRQIAAI